MTIDERFNTPDFVLFDTNSIPFALSEAKVNLDEAPQPGWGVTLWIDCDQINALHAKMEAAGVTIIGTYSTLGRTARAGMRDPSGSWHA